MIYFSFNNGNYHIKSDKQLKFPDKKHQIEYITQFIIINRKKFKC